MRTLAALVLVNLFFVAASVVAAVTVLALGTVAKESAPMLSEAPELWILIGLAGVAMSVWFCVALVRFIGRRHGRTRGRAPG